jgi:hypothetical protein
MPNLLLSKTERAMQSHSEVLGNNRDLLKMNRWRKRLYGYTGIFIVIGIWTPVLWFISHVREHYHMLTFEIDQMDWFSILIFFVLVVATLLAQVGFVLIAHDLAEHEKIE